MLFTVDMSYEGTSKRTRKWNLSPESHDRSNESRCLPYQQNKDTINEHRRATYHRRTTESTLQNNFMIPHKYRTMDDIMERTFPIDSSLSESTPPQHNFVVRCSPWNVYNIGEKSRNREEHHIYNEDDNLHPNHSISTISSFEQSQMLQNIHV